MSFDIKVPDGWTLVKLSDLGEVNRGRSRHRPRDAAHLYNGPYPFVQTGDVKASGGRITQFSQTYSEAGLAQSRLWPTGTMCITIAANIAETGILTFPACFPDSVIGFIADEKKCNVYFIEFVFRLLRKRIQAQATGSVQDNINLQTLERLQFPIPALDEQNRIAEILGKLDDKIYLNTNTNQTLEQMAQAIFKSWFVDFDPVKAKMNGEQPEGMDEATASLFPEKLVESELGLIPEGWDIKTIKDFGKVITGKTPPKKVEDAYSDQGVPFVTPSDIDSDVFVCETKRFLSESGVETVKKNLLPEGSVCVTCIGSQMGKAVISPSLAISNQQINSVVVAKEYERNFLFLNLRRRREEIFLIGSSGSTMPIINKSTFEKLAVLTPSEALIQSFDKAVSALLNKIHQNALENQTLSSLRDTLLPKLLSGEIELDVAEAITND
ncbi:TPA: restriction endonuclease subunit S [Vibrio parahaemolyticus]|nr:restriction endonuclease subunit S [Vibrio parahaemolyticus]